MYVRTILFYIKKNRHTKEYFILYARKYTNWLKLLTFGPAGSKILVQYKKIIENSG